MTEEALVLPDRERGPPRTRRLSWLDLFEWSRTEQNLERMSLIWRPAQGSNEHHMLLTLVLVDDAGLEAGQDVEGPTQNPHAAEGDVIYGHLRCFVARLFCYPENIALRHR